MNTNIFIPKKINVGFQKRSDTYTQKLAYVIYFDQKGVLRKETSWNGWRDNDIENIIYDNVPTSGFVLNKKVGDYVSDWNHRQAYVRVYDPRDFEFEITIENLLYILENASSIKGKGLEGEFTYGWDGKDLILIPVESPDYKGIEDYNDIVFNNDFIKAKDLKIGVTYLTKDNQKMIYMGKFDYYGSGYKDKLDGEVFISYKKWRNHSYSFEDRKTHDYTYINDINGGEKYYFAYESKYDWEKGRILFDAYSSITKKFIAIINENCVENYAELFDSLECQSSYSPIDKKADKYIPYSFKDFEKYINEKTWSRDIYIKDNIKYEIIRQDNSLYIARPNDSEEFNITRCDEYQEEVGYSWNKRTRTVRKPIPTTLKELYEILQPCYREIYLKNGKLYEKEYYYYYE